MMLEVKSLKELLRLVLPVVGSSCLSWKLNDGVLELQLDFVDQIDL